jgi:hypothetical protein
MIQADGTIIRLSSEYLDRPTSISIDAQGNLYIVDNNAVSVYTPTFVIESDPVSIEVTGMSSSFTYTLHTGWNLVSLPIIPDDNNITSIFSKEQQQNIDVIWDYNGGNWKYWTTEPGYPNTLSKLVTLEGYEIYCYNPMTVQINGTSGPQVIPFSQLSQGWNLVGVPTNCSISDVYSPVDVVWKMENGNWYYWTTEAGYTNQYEIMTPGLGYWIYKY